MSPDQRPAIALMTAGLAVLICLDACGKFLGQAGVPVAATTWSRYVGHLLVVLLMYLPRDGRAMFQAERPRLQWARGGLMVVVSLLYFAALKYLPLAQATALFFLTPLVTTALAVWFLRERPGRWTLVAVFLGFLGVLVVVRPGANLAATGVMLVAAAAVCNAGYQTLTRAASQTFDKQQLSGPSRSERVSTQLLYSGLVGAIVMSATLPYWWDATWISAANPTTFLVFLAVGVLGALGHLLLIRAYSLAPASTLAPWMYVQLLWSVALGWLLFNQTPDSVTIIGMLLIGLAPQLTRLNRPATATAPSAK